MIAIPDPVKRKRLKSTLVIIILVTIPCYVLGLIIVWVGNTVKSRTTATPTVQMIATLTPEFMTATLPKPTIVFISPTPSQTPTEGPTPTPSATYFIPSSTPSKTPSHTPSQTPTATHTLTATATYTDTSVPTDIPTTAP